MRKKTRLTGTDDEDEVGEGDDSLAADPVRLCGKHGVSMRAIGAQRKSGTHEDTRRETGEESAEGGGRGENLSARAGPGQ